MTALKKLPGVIHGLENALSQFDEHGLKLHPDTVRQLRGKSEKGGSVLPAVLLFTLALVAVGTALY